MNIVVRNWERFQHRDVARSQRVPPWIRNYTELLSDEAYLNLSGHDRGVLHGIWLEYARTRARLPLDTRSLTRRLGLRVTTTTLQRLNHAGFLEFPLADGAQDSSLEERRGEKTLDATSKEDVTAADVESVDQEDLGDDGILDELSSFRVRKSAGLEVNGRSVSVDDLLGRATKGA